MNSLFANQNIDLDIFLKNYWQQRPCLFKGTDLNLSCLPNQTQLFDLASQEDVQSRIVYSEDGIRYSAIYDDPDAWDDVIDHQPTLLVSDIEKWHPEAATLLKSFPFIKSWRLDDLMISYAPTGASVGAHTDHYDVFLIQIRGQRSWSFDDQPISEDVEFVEGSEMSILANHTANNTHTLSPGDVLYLPPEIAHHGVSLSDDCMTCSIGMRAPSRSEMIMAFAERVAERCDEADRFTDRADGQHQHAFDHSDVNRFRKQIESSLQLSDQEWMHLFGQFFSQYRQLDYQPELTPPSQQLRKNPFVTFTYQQTGGKATLFVNGESFVGDAKEVIQICQSDQIEDSQSPLLVLLKDAEYLI